MTAFLYIRNGEAQPTRRVDFARLASLFVETEEASQDRRGQPLLQIAAAILLLVAAMSDVVVMRPDSLASSAATSRHTFVASGGSL